MSQLSSNSFKVTSMSIDQLNKEYAIADHLKFIKGRGGFPFILIKNASATALVSLYAAQVLSFQPIEEPEDLLFLSQRSHYHDGKAIRGGIPICWPWFGLDPNDPDGPNHGFVRNGLWTVLATEAPSENEIKIKLRFKASLHSEQYWQQPFTLDLDISVSQTLTLQLVTHNSSNQKFSITQALHAYLNIGEIHNIKIFGFEDTRYLDKLDNGTQKYQKTAITVQNKIDRIYKNVQKKLIIDDTFFNRQIIITSTTNKTAVVWNPWTHASATIPDLTDDDYQHFICVEAGNVGTDIVEIQPGSQYNFSTNYKIIRN